VRERGSVLALMPAAVLVFIVLGSIGVDAALVFLGEREVANLAAAIANDAATEGIDVERYYGTGELVVDPARVQQVADAAIARVELDHLRRLTVETEVIGTDVVVVQVRAWVPSLFAKALPDGLEEREVAASARATAERG
jgi:hypothetical protein